MILSRYLVLITLLLCVAQVFQSNQEIYELASNVITPTKLSEVSRGRDSIQPSTNSSSAGDLLYLSETNLSHLFVHCFFLLPYPHSYQFSYSKCQKHSSITIIHFSCFSLWNEQVQLFSSLTVVKEENDYHLISKYHGCPSLFYPSSPSLQISIPNSLSTFQLSLCY